MYSEDNEIFAPSMPSKGSHILNSIHKIKCDFKLDAKYNVH
jgi:hypothetical protein